MKVRILPLFIFSSLICACTPGTYYPFANNPNLNNPNVPNQPARTSTYEPPGKASKQQVVGF